MPKAWQTATRHMRAHDIHGRVVNTSTIGVHRCHGDAAVVLFSCLPEPSFTTGQTLLVDGGDGAGLPENDF